MIFIVNEQVIVRQMYLRQFKGNVTFHELGVESNTLDLLQTLQVCHIREV